MILTLYFRGDISQCNAIDHAIVQNFKKLFSKKAYRHEEDERDSEPATVHTTHTTTRRSILKLLLSLSDQQLFMGLSLALTTYIKLADQDNFSAYSFKMATTTIWLSCLTHISTVLILLREYESFVTGWRVAAIVLLFLLLAPMLVISNLPMFILDPSLSFRCAWDEISSYDRKATLNFSFTAALTVMMVIGGYNRVFNLPKSKTSSSQLIEPKRRRRSFNNSLFNLIPTPTQLYAYEKFVLAVWIKDRIDGIQQLREHPPIPWRVLWLESLRELLQSFLWQLMWLMFYYTFGISSLVVAWTLLPPLQQWSLSYGQLLPVFALVFTFPPLYDDLHSKPSNRRVMHRELTMSSA